MNARDAALDYAVRGWPVLPLWWPLAPNRCACGRDDCGSPGKHPHLFAPNGLHDATVDRDTIAGWFDRRPELNIGLRTGVAFDVLDIDTEAAGAWLARYAADLGEDTAECWQLGPMAVTGHGHHLLYAVTGARNGTRLHGVRGFDWRGQDGYIVAPPSRHHEGRRYEWHPDCGPELPIPTAPAFLVELVTERHQPAPVRAVVAAPVARGGVTTRTRWSADGILGRMARASQGERNDTLVWCAWRIGMDVHDGKVDRATADAAADQLHQVAARTGLGDSEIQTTIRSGYAAGLSGRQKRGAA